MLNSEGPRTPRLQRLLPLDVTPSEQIKTFTCSSAVKILTVAVEKCALGSWGGGGGSVSTAEGINSVSHTAHLEDDGKVAFQPVTRELLFTSHTLFFLS